MNLIDPYGLRDLGKPTSHGPVIDPGPNGGPSGGVPIGGPGDPSNSHIDQYGNFMETVSEAMYDPSIGEGLYHWLTKNERERRELERQKRMEEAEYQRLLQELYELKYLVDFYCKSTGGCNYNPCD